MCWIVQKPAEIDIPVAYILEARDRGNDDGAGVMYVEDDRVVIEKCMGKREDVAEMYERNKHHDLAFHVRNQTTGKVNRENCHPFWVSNKDWGDKYDIALMHNGTIRDIQVDPLMCDSYNYATYFLGPILRKYPEQYRSEEFWHERSALLGTNKLVLLHSKYGFIIVNSARGALLQPWGAWVSSPMTLSPKNTAPAATQSIIAPPAPRILAGHIEDNDRWVAEPDGFYHYRAPEVEHAA